MENANHKQEKIINESKSKNYITGNKIFLLDLINSNTCSELLGHLSNLVDSLEWRNQSGIDYSTFTNPYDISDKKHQIIDIYIDSPGGKIYTMTSLMHLLNIARAKGTIIRTNVFGTAASCASLIAIQGTPEFRIMYEHGYHLVHYGSSTFSIDKEGEIERAAKYENEMRNNINSAYTKCTKLTEEQLKELTHIELGYINAQECLNKKMCDWILTDNGKFIHHTQHVR